MSELEVKISSIKNKYVYREPIFLSYLIRNKHQGDLFVVDDHKLICSVKESDNVLKIILGQTILSVLFDYKLPSLKKLGYNDTFSSEIKIDTPIMQSSIGKDCLLEREEVKFSENILVYLQVEYGHIGFSTKWPKVSLDEFLSWQNLATSNRVNIKLAKR